jgi:hypothetical protein
MLPLSGPPARVLLSAAGIDPQPEGSTYGRWTWRLYELFDCHNLIERHRDAEPWSVPRAREAALNLILEKPLTSGSVTVLLGRRVAAAFGLEDAAWGEWRATPSGAIVTAPHPSGRSRAMNDPETRTLLGRVLNEAIERTRTRDERAN